MPIHNSAIAEMFGKVADLLDISNGDEFRIRAYRTAAQTISSLTRSAAEMVRDKEDLSQLPGIGKNLAGKVKEIVETGSLTRLRELENEVPPGLIALMKISGLGPRKVLTLHKELGISSWQQLEKAAKAGQIREVPGFGEKTEHAILVSLERQASRTREEEGRVGFVAAEQIARPLLTYLRKINGVDFLEVAGSFRRKCAMVADLDLVATCS